MHPYTWRMVTFGGSVIEKGTIYNDREILSPSNLKDEGTISRVELIPVEGVASCNCPCCSTRKSSWPSLTLHLEPGEAFRYFFTREGAVVGGKMQTPTTVGVALGKLDGPLMWATAHGIVLGVETYEGAVTHG